MKPFRWLYFKYVLSWKKRIGYLCLVLGSHLYSASQKTLKYNRVFWIQILFLKAVSPRIFILRGSLSWHFLFCFKKNFAGVINLYKYLKKKGSLSGFWKITLIFLIEEYWFWYEPKVFFFLTCSEHSSYSSSVSFWICSFLSSWFFKGCP